MNPAQAALIVVVYLAIMTVAVCACFAVRRHAPTVRRWLRAMAHRVVNEPSLCKEPGCPGWARCEECQGLSAW